EKAIDRLKEVVRERRKSRVIEEIEENNSHTFKNADGDHLSGIYRWVDKFYRNKVFSYGRRLMYEFYVPEPARFYQYAAAGAAEYGLPPDPDPPTVFDSASRKLLALTPD